MFHVNAEVLHNTALITRTLDKWHRIYGHVNYDYLRDMQRKSMVDGFEIVTLTPNRRNVRPACRASIGLLHSQTSQPLFRPRLATSLHLTSGALRLFKEYTASTTSLHSQI